MKIKASANWPKILNKIGNELMDKDIEIKFETSNQFEIELKVVNGRVFNSMVENKLLMKPGDKRIDKLGRDYLNTTQLNPKQQRYVTKLFKGLCLSGSIAHIDKAFVGGVWTGFDFGSKQKFKE